jgi:hypothetical protein
MELYKVPNHTKIRVVSSGEELMFYHVDGMYSYCLNKDKEVIHLVAWEDVEIVLDKEEEV